MSWWGKIIGGGVGFMLGGPLGAMFGVAIGHNFDNRAGGYSGGATVQHNMQAAFFTATFSVMGCVAKADGRVSPEEIRLAAMVMERMDLDAQQREMAQRLFNQGKAADFELDEVLVQFRSICRRRLDLFRAFIGIQFEAALADGRLHPGEEQVLRHIAGALGLSHDNFEQILNSARYRAAGESAAAEPAHSLADDYKVLGVSEQADDAEVKRAYRRMMNRYHPDKLISKGLPEEMMKHATEMTRRVKSAHERIKKVRATRRGSH